MTPGDRLLFRNAGVLFFARNVRRNPLISDLLHRIEFIEKAGTGIRRILEEARARRCPEPTFEANGFVTVTFRPNPEVRAVTGDGRTTGEVTGEVTPRDPHQTAPKRPPMKSPMKSGRWSGCCEPATRLGSISRRRSA